MSEQQSTNQPISGDDQHVQGHTVRHRADAEATEEQVDAEGHRWVLADAETTEDDDTEGHRLFSADPETAEGDDDVEGHAKFG